MVNQNQLLELMRKDILLSHLDLPYFDETWDPIKNDSGFDAHIKEKINHIKRNNLTTYKPDITYRISFPYRYYPSKGDKLFVFGTSEFQNIDGCVFNNELTKGLSNKTMKRVTPSEWSKIGFMKAGFDDSRIKVIPHGVNAQTFKPLTDSRKTEIRRTLNVRDDEFLILSLGAMTQNKGVDVLLRAFAKIKEKYKHVRLLLKDSSNLYRVGIQDVIDNLNNETNIVITREIAKSIISINSNLNQTQLNEIYCAADCYVSPYRAEGFNLPPLEAAACGTPIIITKGGSTDDYFDESFAMGIEGKKIDSMNSTYIEPSLDSLIGNLITLIEGKQTNLNKTKSRELILKKFTWEQVTNKLVMAFDD